MTVKEFQSEGMQMALRDGWRDVHGGGSTGGIYWRGIDPETNKMGKLPRKYTDLIPLA